MTERFCTGRPLRTWSAKSLTSPLLQAIQAIRSGTAPVGNRFPGKVEVSEIKKPEIQSQRCYSTAKVSVQLSKMPKKIRELKAILLKAGFVHRPGKGSHTVWSHALLDYSLTLSGKDGADADRYQERDVRNAIKDLDVLEDGAAE